MIRRLLRNADRAGITDLTWCWRGRAWEARGITRRGLLVQGWGPTGICALLDLLESL